MSDEFVHLHVHTEFSLLDGLSQIKRLVKRAADTNMEALAITDHGTMFGVIDFYRECKKQGVKPIIGCEAYLTHRDRRMTDKESKLDTKPYHMLLLARNQIGYQNLLHIASAAQLEGYYYRPRIDHEFLAAHSEGLIATSGCLASEIPRMVEQGRDQEALDMIGWYQDVFGPENYYLELQHHNINELHILNKWLIQNQQHARVPLLATNDVHYVLDDDFDSHDTLLCIQTGNVKSEQNRLRFTSKSFHLRSPQEMWALFGEVPEALTNSLLIAEQCNVNLDSDGYHLPVFPVPEGYTAESYLRYLCEKGLNWRYGTHASDPVVRDRLEYELNIIHSMGFDTYFLIVWDLCEFARHADIWWNVRGSGAGSVAAYSLGITNIDPLQNSLLFERFLNPGRVSMPDIDLDYPEDRRAEMIQYCAQKYGEDKVAAIITFGTMGSKAAIRDVGRALDLPLPEVDRIARLIPSGGKPIKFDDALGDDTEKALPDLKAVYETDPTAHKLIDAARALEGITRHASTHAAGVIVADKPLVQYIPLHRVTSGSEEDAPVKMVTQFPMETCESIGLLKVDFLGLSTLTIMRKACEMIERYHTIHYDLSNIPYRPDPDDPEKTRRVQAAFEMMGRGETIGVFQLESQGMRRMLTDMRPQKFENIVAGISLYRPGPLEFIPTYNRRLHGDEEIEYRHPLLEPILKETYGICVSGDTLVFDVKTGQRYRVDQLANTNEAFYIQGIHDSYAPTAARVTHLIDNGEKPVFRVTFRSGATIKATQDHRFLMEHGWESLDQIKVGDYLGTPPHLLEPEEPLAFDREKLRVLAYLIADGSLASGCSVDFVNKDQRLIDEYVRCLESFGDITPVFTEQIHGVTRVGIRHNRKYKEVTSLLAWMRELGFKYPPGTKHPRGVRSHEKSIPEFVFRLSNADIAYFLASLWDCDGFTGERFCHYKTISERLAHDVQTLLLRLGISSAIYQSTYESSRNNGSTGFAYQVTVYNTVQLAKWIFPHMLTEKRDVTCESINHTTINRIRFIEEVQNATHLSSRELMNRYGIDRQHFYQKAIQNRPRISAHIVTPVAEAVPLPETQKLVNIVWEEVVSIEPAGVEHVYDLTVDGIHNFVANNILVHNCVYQEQIMQIAGQLFGYELGEADLMRRAVSKKKAAALQEHRKIFAERGPDHGVDPDSANAIFDDIEFFARYGFNKCVAGDTEIIDAETGRLVTVRDLAEGRATIEHTITLDTSSMRLISGPVTQVMENGVKPVYRLTTQLGRQITVTDNHPFYTFEGWRLLRELAPGDQIAVPRRIPVEWPEEKSPLRVWRGGQGGEVAPQTIRQPATIVAESDIYWDKIISIEPAGEEPTYDLTVPGTHNFVANGIIVHNSHAADYAVLTCQTAFLKCHYPHEYMASLMSVHRDDSAKVSLFAADCARMNIAVLPPTVNDSGLDFTIEGKVGTPERAVRFGMGAVKNVGVGPLEHIIAMRDDGGPFRDLDDFCRRVDLRIVQKRALESLIRVGALDEFAPRPTLLAALDRIMSFSADYHKAQEVGQMSLFGEATGVEFGAMSSILANLPHIDQVNQREMLRWEKELVGLYVTDHPLRALADKFVQANIRPVAELVEEGDAVSGQAVNVAGLVTDIRSIITKKGDPMAILTVEDITGTISAVMFPRTWTQYREMVAEDVVVVINGKADTSRGDLQVIVDTVTQNIETVQAIDHLPKLDRLSLDWMIDSASHEEDSPYDEETGEMVSDPTPEAEPLRAEAMIPASGGASVASAPPIEPPTIPRVTDREMPGWMESEPDDWVPVPDWADSAPAAAPSPPRQAVDASGRLTAPPASAARPRQASDSTQTPAPAATPHIPQRRPPAPKPAAPPPGRLLSLYIRRSGDSSRDRARLQRLHGYLTQYPGHDRFRFIVERENQPPACLEFPRHSIEINDDILNFARKFLGNDYVEVEEP